MNSKKIILNGIKYVAALMVAAFLLWYVYKDFDFSELQKRLHQVNFYWIYLSIALSLISHVFRAYRWNLLLKPLGYKHLRTWRTFLAVMSGYFVNLLLPRAGEVTRCGVLRKNEGVPISSSFGSVIAERIFDLIVLILFIAITFFLQIDLLGDFLGQFFGDKFQAVSDYIPFLIISGSIILLLFFACFFLYKRYQYKLKQYALYNKVALFIKELSEGFLSIRKLDNQAGFWFSTAMIWILYFLMSYVVFFSLPSTTSLGLLAGLSVLIMGGLGMSAPVQGGIGAYHLLVGGVLVLYGISKDEGVFFALLLHTSQFISLVVFGGSSLVITLFQKKSSLKNL